MDSYNQGNCCDNLFAEFKFQDLVSAQPPSEKGVYVIRVKIRGEKIKIMIDKTNRLVTGIGWELVKNRIMNRVKRLERIGQCPIIYIGSAGTQPRSKNTLKGRYKEFSSRHTAMYPIRILLYFGWKLEFGWNVCDGTKKSPEQREKFYYDVILQPWKNRRRNYFVAYAVRVTPGFPKDFDFGAKRALLIIYGDGQVVDVYPHQEKVPLPGIEKRIITLPKVKIMVTVLRFLREFEARENT